MDTKQENSFVKLSDLMALCLILRWCCWLLLQIPAVCEAWTSFLQTVSGQALQIMFSTGTLGQVWFFVTIVLLGVPGTVAFFLALLCSRFSDVPFDGFLALTRLFHHLRHPQRPVYYHTIRRCYLRVIQNGHEQIFNLSRDKLVSFSDPPLTVRLERDEALLSSDKQFILSLPPNQWKTISGISFEFIPFFLKMSEYK